MRIKEIPEDLHHRFKLLCVTKRVSMNGAVIKLIRDAVATGSLPDDKR